MRTDRALPVFVSIRAPAKERLKLAVGHWYYNRVSIRAPAKERRLSINAFC